MSAVTVIHRLNRRLNKACRLMVDFLGVRVVILGSIPVAYWLIKRLPLTWKGKPLSDLSLLVVSYLIVGGGVYVWKFIEAGRVLKAEDRISHPRKKYVQNKLAG